MAILSDNSSAAKVLLAERNCILVNRQDKIHVRRYTRNLKCKNALSSIKVAYRAHYAQEFDYKPLFKKIGGEI